MRFVRRCVVAAVVLPLLATGCSGDPQPKFEPSPSASPSASSSVRAEPKAWEVKSDKGAYAFVQHWVSELNEAGKTGDTRGLNDLSSANCESCKNIIDYITEVYDEGGRIESDGWRVLQVAQIDDRLPPRAPVVPARVRQTGQDVFRTRPEKQVRVPPETVAMSFHLEWANSWRMADLVVVN